MKLTVELCETLEKLTEIDITEILNKDANPIQNRRGDKKWEIRVKRKC